MKKAKNLLIGTLATTMLMGSLAGCGAKSPTTTPTPVPTGEATATPKADEQAKKLTGEVVYWSMWQETEPQAEILKQAIEKFQAANTDVKVTVEWSGRDVKNLIMPALESGQKVDIFDTDPMNMYKADVSKLMNLDDLYASKALDSDKTMQESILGGLVEWDKALGAQAGSTGTHSVPYAPYVVSWFYNKDLFKKAGIAEVPKTWEELDAACAKLVAIGVDPITTDDAYMNLLYSYYLERGIGEENIKKIATEGGDSWKEPMIAQTAKAMEDFAKKGYFSKDMKTNKYPAGQMQFAQGGAAMYLNASFLPGEVKEATGDNFPWGEFPYPTLANGSGKITENTIGGQAFMVNAATDNKEAAYELMRYFVSNETQGKFLEKGLVPCTAETEWPKEVSDQKAIVNDLTKNINWGASLDSEFVESVIKPEFAKVLTGGQTADQCVAEILKQAEATKK
ncbi:MAG: ABC transporter substrate-binding protein [Cellulosilyticaceae bacterium]